MGENLGENALMIVGRKRSRYGAGANALLGSGGGIAIVDKNEILELIGSPFGGIFAAALA